MASTAWTWCSLVSAFNSSVPPHWRKEGLGGREGVIDIAA